jgi:hypothetical protein|nr:HNH endonuclease [uncultured Intestinibacter sp.]
MAKRKLNRDRLEVDENVLKLLKYGEEIKPIRNCNNYYVTTHGRVFSNKYMVQYQTLEGEEYYYVVWKELKQRLTSGYYCVNITDNEGIRRREYIHKLVYETFNNFVDTSTLKIVHRDKNKLNNRVGNLAVTWRKKTDYQAHKNYAYRVKMQQIV